MNSNNTGYNIQIYKVRAFGVFGLLLFGYVTFVSYNNAELFASIGGFLFAALSLYVLLFYGSIDINDQVIRHTTFFGTHEIQWSEIKDIYSSQGIIVLIGANKRLSITDIEYWSGSDKDSAIEFYWNQIDKLNISFTKSSSALFMMSKNSKIN